MSKPTRCTHRPVTRNVLLHGDRPEEKRRQIREYFHATFDIYERLFEPLRRDEAYFLRPEPLRHPLIFYYGHTATFFINKLVLAKVLDRRIDPRLESICAIGVDEMSWDDLDETHYEWPSVEEVRAYRKKVREEVDRVITTLPLTLPIDWESPFWVILMGIEHERIHLETSSVLIRQLPIEEVRPHSFWAPFSESSEAPENVLQEVPAGEISVGKTRDDRLYGWDNEYGRHRAEVRSFAASRYLVSNGEYLAFVRGGGYENPDWWTEEGQRWLAFSNRKHPVFWIPEGDGYRYRSMLEEHPMPWDWPVDVNYLEAKAFCRWKSEKLGRSIRLPTEDEWYRLRDHCNVSDEPEWQEAPGNINLEFAASACPVTRFAFGEFFDVIGNVWQWTETPIDGFDGFTVHPLYDDFSTPTFDERHNLIKGGSFISTGNEVSASSRYAFRRHFYQHAGFRYIESDAPVETQGNVYETDSLLSQYCEFHYGARYFDVENFPKACSEICLQAMQDEGVALDRALDIGCATGRSTFELAKQIRRVTGLDFSARFIRLAVDLQERGRLRYVLPEEGELVSYHERTLDELGLAETACRVEFFQADACNLKPLYSGYDLVLAANLLDRLYAPRKFLASIHERIRSGGLLVLTSPYTWLEEYTQKKEWVGGFKRDGENFTTLDGLREILSAHFERVGQPRNLPFVIRETRRKFQHTIAELTIWKKR